MRSVYFNIASLSRFLKPGWLFTHRQVHVEHTLTVCPPVCVVVTQRLYERLEYFVFELMLQLSLLYVKFLNLADRKAIGDARMKGPRAKIFDRRRLSLVLSPRTSVSSTIRFLTLGRRFAKHRRAAA